MRRWVHSVHWSTLSKLHGSFQVQPSVKLQSNLTDQKGKWFNIAA